MKYFFDTYALIEIFKSNSNYLNYLDEEIITTELNLIEFFYAMLKNLGEEKAKKFYLILKNSAVDLSEIEDEIIFEAIKFKINSKKNLSYVDCIGYFYALKKNLRYLTGDIEFKELENVEFVK